jgi:recombination protein RecA
MLSDRGINLTGDVLDLAAAQKIVERSGSWFTYGEHRLGQGRDKARLFLDEHPEIMNELRDKVLEAFMANGRRLPSDGLADNAQ